MRFNQWAAMDDHQWNYSKTLSGTVNLWSNDWQIQFPFWQKDATLYYRKSMYDYSVVLPNNWLFVLRTPNEAKGTQPSCSTG